MVEQLLKMLASEDISADSMAAITRPFRFTGIFSITTHVNTRSNALLGESASTTPASSIIARPAIPGSTMMNPGNSFSSDASMHPACPCRTFFAARVRCTMTWSQAQYHVEAMK